jgi:DNA-binding transcriptional LysR family regulator
MSETRQSTDGAGVQRSGRTEVNLRNFDLNLLVIFQAIMARGSVVGAANQVGLSPSAVSHALSRLRVMLNDELFHRTSQGLQPTVRALELCDEVTTGLSHIANAIELQHRFEPLKTERVFTLQIADYVSGMLLPRLAKRLRSEAPGVSAEVVPFSVDADSRADTVDVQVRFTPGDLRPTVARSQRLLTDRFIVVMRPDHPAAGQDMTVELYASLNHVRLSPTAIGTTIVDDALARRGLKRHVVMTVPGWFDMPEIVENTDMVAIVPSRWPLADARLAKLHSVPLPLDEVRFAIDLCWDVRRERDPGQRWFRGLIAAIFKESGESE